MILMNKMIFTILNFSILFFAKFGTSKKIENLFQNHQIGNQSSTAMDEILSNLPNAFKTIYQNRNTIPNEINYNVNINIWLPYKNESSFRPISTSAKTKSTKQVSPKNLILSSLLKQVENLQLVGEKTKTFPDSNIHPIENRIDGFSMKETNYKSNMLKNDYTKEYLPMLQDVFKSIVRTKESSNGQHSFGIFKLMGNLKELMKYIQKKKEPKKEKKFLYDKKVNNEHSFEEKDAEYLNNKKLPDISRNKRSTDPKNETEEVLPTARIVNRESIYPKSFNFNSLITDILLDRYPQQGPWPNKPHRYHGNRYPPNPGFTRPYMTEINQSVNKIPLSTPSSFDDLSLGSDVLSEEDHFDIGKRLGKLDSIFKSLNIDSEECRRRIMCEVARDANELSPLAEVLQHETKFSKNYRKGGRNLLNTKDGVRFLSYIDATTRGQDEFRQCDIYKYHCRYTIKDLIDMDALMVWREVVGWLTLKVLVKER